MESLLKLFPAGHLVVSVLFVVSAFSLIALAGYELWEGLRLFVDKGLEKRTMAF